MNIRKFIASGGGVGYSPYAPGTVMSFVTVVVVFYLPKISLFWQAALLTVLFFIGVSVSEYSATMTRDADPRWVVIDELVGMWIAICALPKSYGWYLAAFILFRILDITKACGVSYFERLPGGWGIMLDDVVAGLMTGVVLKTLQLLG